MAIKPIRIRIRCTDSLGNINYLHTDLRPGKDDYLRWSCTSARGTPVGWEYAVGPIPDIMKLRFALEECKSAEAALRVVKTMGLGGYKFELV